MQQRLSLVSLGVGDLAAARGFYARLGWREAAASHADIAFFDLGGFALALFARDALAADAGVDADGRGFAGVTLAHNVATPRAVDATLAEAVAAGGRLVKPAEATAWGGYSGYFADPDGHLWEVAHNPFALLDAAGRFHVDGPP
jgi:catechol 2,3-dioxygenase-like lactoylglutathione lyase family enzyme